MLHCIPGKTGGNKDWEKTAVKNKLLGAPPAGEFFLCKEIMLERRNYSLR